MPLTLSTRFDACRKCHAPVTLRMQPHADSFDSLPRLHFSIWYCPHCHAPNTAPAGADVDAVPGHRFETQQAS